MTAYRSEGLSALAYANGHTHWHYRYDGDGAPHPDHFHAAHKMMRAGDQISFQSATHMGVLGVVRVEPGRVTAHLGWHLALE